jgi:hypothetical protein
VEEVAPDPGFIKVLGKQGSSSGNKLLELPNGDLLIAGKLGVPAFDIKQTTDDILFGRAQDLAPTIMITDKSGNIKKIRSYPINEWIIHNDIFQVSDFADKASFIDVVQMDDGGYFALGQFSAFTFKVPSEGYIRNDTQVQSPFLMKLNANLDMEFFRSFNGEEGWDTVFHIVPKMKKLNDGNLLILFGLDKYLPFSKEDNIGYSLLKLSPEGKTLAFRKYPGQKYAQNLSLDDQGNIILIGQDGAFYSCFKIPLGSLEMDDFLNYEQSYSFGNPWKVNEMFVYPQPDNTYYVIYAKNDNGIRFEKLDSDFKYLKGFDLVGNNSQEYPRAAYETKSGEYLVYSEWLDDNLEVSQGFLYKLNQNNEILFKIPFEGIPGDAIEYSDGSLLVMSNATYNNLLLKVTITKLSADGKIY